MILNLDPSFKPLSGDEIHYESFIFNGGEPHIKIHPDFNTKEEVWISQRIRKFEDLGLILLTVDALRSLNVKIIKLFIPYFPAARQDRRMIPGEPLSVKVYTSLINELDLDEVLIFDPHSDVTPALLNNCRVISNHGFIAQVLKNIGSEVMLVSPDAGAAKKIFGLATALQINQVVECSKHRNVQDGSLKGFRVLEDDLGGKDCLVVDDICDGGGTFIGLAEELKNKNAGKLYLAVSHGIFSKGFEDLQCFEKIFCTNSFQDVKDENVEQIKIEL